MSIFSNPQKVFDNIWNEFSHLFKDDIAPFIKQFLEQFASDEGRMILAESLVAVPRLKNEAFSIVATDVLANVTAKSAIIAAQDAGKTLLSIQSALQIGKVADNVLTPSDTALVAGVA